MNWISQTFFAISISSVTGTVMLCVWRLLRGFFMKFNPDLIYVTLRWVCLLYIMPIGYLAAILCPDRWIRGPMDAWKTVFLSTNWTGIVLKVFVLLWFLTSCCIFIFCLVGFAQFHQGMKGNVPEEEELAIQTYEEVCRKLHISSRKPELCRNDVIHTPMLVHFIHSQIVLPYGVHYNLKELEVVLTHELMHYKHHDLLIKMSCMWIMMIHCLNPTAFLLLKLVSQWSEYMADVSAVKQLSNGNNSSNKSEIDAKQYFHCIVNLMPGEKSSDKNMYLFSTLYNTKEELNRRIDFMKKYQNVKKVGKVTTAIMAAAFVFVTSATSAFAGTSVAESGYSLAEQLPEAAVSYPSEKLVVAADGMVEHYVDVKDLDMNNITIISEDTLPQNQITDNLQKPIKQPLKSSGINGESWTVSANTRHVTSEFKVNNGGWIQAAAGVSPSTQYFMLGIMDNAGHARYVSGTGSLGHLFNITTTSKYRVFVQNDSRQSIKAVVSYSYSDN